MSRTWCAVAALLALAAPLDARFPVHETVSGLFAQEGSSHHPTSEQQVLRITNELRGDEASLVLHYWRTVDRNENQGRVSVRVKVVREIDGRNQPETLYRKRVKGRVWSRQFVSVLTDLPDLRPGDLILISYRLQRMPRLELYDLAYAETLLRDDAPD